MKKIDQLANEFEKMIAVESGFAFGEPESFVRWLAAYRVDKSMVLPIVAGRKPDSVSQILPDDPPAHWFMLDDGSIAGLWNPEEPGPDGTWGYRIPATKELPVVADYAVPDIPSV
jgi:hypothetical protein